MSETSNPNSSAPVGNAMDPSDEHRAAAERRLSATAAQTHVQLLPGVAGICIYMLIMAMMNAFASMRGVYGQGRLRVCILVICTLMIAGIFGLLRMRRWGWAVVTAGSLLMSLGDMYVYIHVHQGFYLIRALFGLFFFLYLVRPEVRTRLR